MRFIAGSWSARLRWMIRRMSPRHRSEHSHDVLRAVWPSFFATPARLPRCASALSRRTYRWWSHPEGATPVTLSGQPGRLASGAPIAVRPHRSRQTTSGVGSLPMHVCVARTMPSRPPCSQHGRAGKLASRHSERQFCDGGGGLRTLPFTVRAGPSNVSREIGGLADADAAPPTLVGLAVRTPPHGNGREACCRSACP